MWVFAEAEHWLVVADIVFSIAWEDDPLTVFFSRLVVCPRVGWRENLEPHIWVKTMTVMVSCKFARRQSIEHQESGLWYVPTWLEITKNYWEKDILGLLRGLCSWDLPILGLKWMSRFWTVQEKCADRHIFVCLAKEATVIQSFVVVHASFWCRNRTGWSLQVSLSIPIWQNLSWISPWAFHSNFCMISPTNSYLSGVAQSWGWGYMGMVPADWLTSPLNCHHSSPTTKGNT